MKKYLPIINENYLSLSDKVRICMTNNYKKLLNNYAILCIIINRFIKQLTGFKDHEGGVKHGLKLFQTTY
jgi:hypothetical protein